MFTNKKLSNLSSVRLLYIEDDLETREALQFTLEHCVAELYSAKNGREGLDLYREHLPDIVVTDIQMPEMNGLVMATEIRTLNPEQAIVILSAHDDAEYLFRTLALGIQHYIAKPISIEHLLCTLSDITERKNVQKKLRDREHMLSESQRIGHIGSWSMLLETSRITWSDEMYRIYGLTAESFGHSLQAFRQLIVVEDQCVVDAWINDGLAGKKMPELDFRIIRPDGEIRFICASGELQYDDIKRPLRIVGCAQDITLRKQTDAKLNAIFNASVEVGCRNLTF